MFRAKQNPLPDPKTQANIGNLAAHYLDQALTRIEILIESGKHNAAKAEFEALETYFKQRDLFERSTDMQMSVPASKELVLALEYIEKLYKLVEALLEAATGALDAKRLDEAKAKNEEATALTKYINELSKRIRESGQRFERMTKRIKKRR